ncbi:MAG: TetR/AcrR family transcriptional regulator [Pseudomonadales bacterium]|jgi:AcrR family transcriptional regulator|nr:TetR/AcrR family transcriptional regulator [Pseudomonadales bacterium]
MPPPAAPTARSNRARENESLRERIVEVAARLLVEAGPHALSVRRVAQDAGTSTQGIYTEFGGKAGLVEALYREGWRRLRTALERVPAADDAVEQVVRLGEAYRRCARENPHFYALMVGEPIPGFAPSEAVRRNARASMRILLEAVRAAMDERGRHGDPERIAHLLWASGHGLVDLGLHGLARAEDEDDRARTLTHAILEAFTEVDP